MAFKISVIMACFISMFQLFLNGEQAQTDDKFISHTYQIKKAAGKIKIDGRIDEEAWGNALVLDVNNEILPSENIVAPVKTECLVLYDDKNLYVAFKAYDHQPKQIRAYMSDRDNIYLDDMVGIFVDTFNDRNRAFVFFCNPLGIQMDEILSDGGAYEDDSWDAIWLSAAHIDDKGYEVEMAIPFQALQFPGNTVNQTWGFVPVRLYPRSQRHQITNIIHNRDNPCLLCQSHKLTGIEGASPGRNIELDPTLTAFRTDERKVFPDEPMKKKEAKLDAGISASWGFTSNLTLSATVNPDFSQVEADIAQQDINTQFVLYYPEKRPFFMEGKDFFSTFINAVYTRTLMDPSWGVKISGKEGKNALGFFLSRDQITSLIFPGAEGSKYTTLNQGATAGVFRYRRDIGPSSTVGILFTDREGKDYYNRLAGVDGLVRIGRSDSIRFQVLGSSTLYPATSARKFLQKEQRMSGYAMNFSLRRDARTYGWNLSYENFSPDFRADLGFIPRVNYWKGFVSGNYSYWGGANSFFPHIGFGGDLFQVKDHRGHLLEREVEMWVDFEMPLQSIISLYAGKQKKIYNYVPFNQDFLHLYCRVRPSGNINLACYLDIKDDIDYAHTRWGKYFCIEPQVNYNIGKHLQASLSYSYSYLDVEQGRLFRTHLAQGKLLYHFSRWAFLRGIIQYTDVSRDITLYRSPENPENRRLFMQFLFSYKLNPRTVLFLGYSDIYDGLLDVPLKQTNRTLFLKIGYALSM
ncbi:MAG: DUF5916 domain-containing protein [Candidatus Aminicenantes bacterium]|nr:DUF5916 domain-containing protein [Candidatus Aminicenantes bacterium]